MIGKELYCNIIQNFQRRVYLFKTLAIKNDYQTEDILLICLHGGGSGGRIGQKSKNIPH